MARYDVLVAGAGPVGLACAIEAAQRGLAVAVLDPRTAPIDKACGEGLMPGAVSALAQLGVRPAGAPFTGITYVDPKGVARHTFRAGPGLGVRRTTLQSAMSGRAAALGVVRFEGKVEQIRQVGDAVTCGDLTGSWLLGCDGLHSAVRGLVGLEPRRATSARRFGQRRHLALAPWSEHVEVHWGPWAEAYVTPVGPDLVGVAVLGPPGQTYEQALAGIPTLRERLADAVWATPVRGAGPLRQSVPGRVAGRVLLVGDAAGYVDALTGEGIRTGLACARSAVDAIAAGHPASYERDWRRLTRSYRVLTTALVTATRQPFVRRHLVTAARAVPPAFGLAVESLAKAEPIR
jgi:flavin-dependent dehydrogenase